MVQKIVNTIAIASGVVSLAVVGLGGYVYLNRNAIIEDVKERALEAVTGNLPGVGALGGASGSLPSLPSKSPSADADPQGPSLPLGF
tara:strand:+ start:357 stop:617 length:261 start_codon:yes stop_codon:yes gene_type:complete